MAKGRGGVKGRGTYASDWWKSNRKYVPRVVGGAIGSLFGAPTKGWSIGADVSKDLLGWGKYRRRGVVGSGGYGTPWSVVSNSLVSDGNIPSVIATTEGGVHICRQEYLGTVVSSTGFTNIQYYLNPGLPSSFPWLSKLASNFQQYRLRGMIVTFKSQMTEAVASYASLGSVAIAVNLNAADRACTSQIEMEQLKYCAVSKASEDIVAPVECARSQGSNVNYVRSAAVPNNASIIDYDHGLLQIATNGCPTAGVILGRVYISYDVELLNPRMVMTSTGIAAYRLTAPTTTDYLGTLAGMVKVTDTIGLTFTSPNNQIFFPIGTYGSFLVHYQVTGASTTLTNNMDVEYTNCRRSTTYKPYWASTSGQAFSGNGPGVVGTDQFRNEILEIIDVTQQASIKFVYGTLPTGAKGSIQIIALAVTPGDTTLPALTHPSVHQDEFDDEKDSVIIEEEILARPGGAAAGAATLGPVASAVQRFQRKALPP